MPKLKVKATGLRNLDIQTLPKNNTSYVSSSKLYSKASNLVRFLKYL